MTDKIKDIYFTLNSPSKETCIIFQKLLSLFKPKTGRDIYFKYKEGKYTSSKAIKLLKRKKSFEWLISLCHDFNVGDFKDVENTIRDSHDEKAIAKWNSGYGTAIKIKLKVWQIDKTKSII